MVKFLPIVVLVILVAVVLATRLSFFSEVSEKITPSENGKEDRLSTLEQAVLTLNDKLEGLTGTATPSTSVASIKNLTSDDRLKSLEKSVKDLTGRVEVLEEGKGSPKSPLYIPLGTGGVSSSLEYTTVDTYELTLDPADYPGYSSVNLEVSLRVFQGNGKAFARLYNSTDGKPIYESEVTSANQNYVWVTSSGFSLSTGKKIYKLQLRTNTGYEASIQNARLKVNF